MSYVYRLFSFLCFIALIWSEKLPQITPNTAFLLIMMYLFTIGADVIDIDKRFTK
jgi:hypothetical protein